VSALRNFSKGIEFTRILRIEAVDVLIDCGRDPRYEKMRNVVG
jgi:hypothetical protein